MFAKALAHVTSVRESVLAAALPDPTDYMQLQSQVLLLSSDRRPAKDSLVPVQLSPRGSDAESRLSLMWDADDEDDDPPPKRATTAMTRDQHRLVASLKTSLDGPLDDSAVRSSWVRAWMLVPLVVAVALVIGLIAWLMSDK